MKNYVSVDNSEALAHYGKGHLDGGHSGRYPWGSGEEKFQRATDWLDRQEAFERENPKPTAEMIKEKFGMTPGQYKQEKAICIYERKCGLIARARTLADNGVGATEIGKKMGVTESTVRGWLDPKSSQKIEDLYNTTEVLKKSLEKHKMVDIGPSVELELGVSSDRLNLAARYLESREGYHIYGNTMQQAANANQRTIQKILARPEVEKKETYHLDEIGTVTEYHSDDNGKTFNKFHYPTKLDPSRMYVRYAEEGGTAKEGVMEIRPGVKDLNLNGKNYAQVRILVDGQGDKFENGHEKNYYMKGMAVYGKPEDFPPGVDIIFNTMKHNTKPWREVLKPSKDDPENPFGSTIAAKGQHWYEDEKTGEKKLNIVNKRADEDEWDKWGDSFSGQFLSKQPLALIKKQLKITQEQKHAEYDEIMKIDNPVVRKYYLDKFASECDSTAVHLKAAKIPGSKFHVILPLTEGAKDDECYAPNYPNGTKLALVRYPHGGTFEIPVVTVNNNIAEGKRIIGNGSDAIAITKKAADQLSGADYDGDTVMAIPTGKNGINILHTPPLEGLKDFDGKEAYPPKPGMVVMTADNKGREMGVITNLITDMTLQDPSPDELARAVRHSMVIVDAYKHKLDYKQSEKDNNIKELREKYQRSYNADGQLHIGGTTTIISRATSQARVLKRQGQPKINVKGKDWYDPELPEGALIYKEATGPYGARYQKAVVNKKTGEVTYKEDYRYDTITKMEGARNAYELMANPDPTKAHPKELAYADFANDLKALANTARKEYMMTENMKYDKEAATTYATEVASLQKKLDGALMNKGIERAAQRRANVVVKEYRQNLIDAARAENPDLDADAIKKVLKSHKDDISKKATQALNSARADLGGKSRKERNIEITDEEWKAIQAGAISNSKLEQILNNSDPDSLRSKATPNVAVEITDVQLGKVMSMLNDKNPDGTMKYTQGAIKDATGVSLSTIQKIKKGEM